MTCQDNTSAPSRYTPPEYSDAFWLHVVVQRETTAKFTATEYMNLAAWQCRACGAVVTNPDQHSSFHETLYRQACRG